MGRMPDSGVCRQAMPAAGPERRQIIRLNGAA